MKPLTPNMNDEELDHLFRQAAERHAQQGSSTDDLAEKAMLWSKIEDELQNPTHMASPRRRKRGYFLLLLLAAIGVSFWLFVGRNDQVGHSAANTDFSAEKAKASAAPKGSSLQADSKTTGGNNTISVHEKGDENTNYHTGNDQMHTAHAYSKANASRFASNGQQKNNLSGWVDQFQNTTQMKSIRLIGGREKPLIPFSSLARIPIPDLIPGIPYESHFFKKGKVSTPPEPETDSDSTAVGRNKKGLSHNPSPVRHWQLGLTIGPDWNSASGHGWRTGVGGGLKLSYRLNNKWAISSGVLIDKKLYDARPNDYNPPDNNWRNYDVKSIDANCTVVEVPINIDYSLWRSSASRIFIGTGLSSLWMHNEEYTYRYKTAGGEWDQWNKKMHDQNHHLFSLINLSPGYERSFQHLSIQVAPYIKIPISGIGYGKVKLYSTGVHFTLQYGLK
jgi:hypothetical protein